MKKIAILLALALALSCCLLMLAACGGEEDASSAETTSGESSSAGTSSKEESSAATSSEATSPAEETSSVSEESSQPVETSDPETSDPETSDPEPSGGDAVESKELTGDPVGDNLALGATVISGADVNTAASQYNANLTDGKAHGELTYDGEWFAYWYNTSDADVESKSNCPGGVAKPVVDLGEVMAIKAARINVFLGNISGIQNPKEIVFSFSEDGENWTDFGTATYPVPTVEDSTVGWVGFEMSKAVDARYVRVSMTVTGSCWTFINEIEVY